MKKTIFYMFLFLIFPTGCSLFSSNENKEGKSEDKMVLFSEENGDEEFDGDVGELDSKPEAESSQDGISTEEGFTNNAGIDEYGDDEYGDDGYANDETNLNSGEPDISSSKTELPISPMTGNQEKDLFVSQESGSSFDDTFSNSNQMVSMIDEPKKLIPVKKMKSSVYQRSGANINRLYIVRSGDNIGAIAIKVYGSDRSEDIYSYNPHLRGKKIHVGDKIYYQSPHNPGDSTMKTYYEDNSLQPQYYVTQEGDNLREFAKKLLGHKRSWMEIYATNANIESKERLPAGLQIRYWPTEMRVAENSNLSNSNPPPSAPNPPPSSSEEAPPVPDQEPPPPSGDHQQMAMDQSQEPPQPLEENMGNMEEPVAQTGSMNIDNSQENDKNLPPPSPETSEGVNQPSIEPAVPPSKKLMASTKKNLKKFTEDQKLMFALGGLMVAVAIILLILIRRNRSRKVNFGHTQS